MEALVNMPFTGETVRDTTLQDDRHRPLLDPPAGKRGWPWEKLAVDPGPAPPGGWPRITLVTPSYNQGRFIEETLRSVVLQGYPDLEWRVHDGGSTDGAVDHIRRYAPWMAHWVSEKDRGQSHAINNGLAPATGDLVGWINSDDTLLPGALFAWARAAAAHPKAVGIVGGVRNVDAEGRTIDDYHARDLDADRLARWNAPGGSVICQPGCLMRRSALQAAGLLVEDLHYTMDVDLWLRLVRVGPFATIPDLVATNRIYADAKTYRDVMPRIIEHASVLQRHRLRDAEREFLAWNGAELMAAVGHPLPWLARIPARRLLAGLAAKVARRLGRPV
ncbi:MAG: hypothetical protein RLZZ127_631 [Planctomycetota bacterium]|jgi:GT2 family glycosyltransferase